MTIFSYAAIGITGAVLAVTIKKTHPEIATAVSLATGLILMLGLCTSLADIFKNLKSIADSNGISGEYLSAAVKACIVAYVTQFSAELCKDAGESAVAVKIEMAGKITIVLMALPVVSSFIGSISDLLNNI